MREIHTNVSRFDFESVHAVRRRKEARLRFPRQADGAPLYRWPSRAPD
jgi:hypothetical protein